jgi:hypothetical protein
VVVVVVVVVIITTMMMILLSVPFRSLALHSKQVSLRQRIPVFANGLDQ